MKAYDKKRLSVMAVILVMILAVVPLLLLIFRSYTPEDKPVNETESTDDTPQNSYLHITHNGKEYTYNSRILTILYAGIDSDEGLTTYDKYTVAPQADTIELIILDDYNKRISVLAISKGTTTSIARYNESGNYMYHYDTVIGKAYTYGNGGKASCDNLAGAVRKLLKNVPIHEYAVTDISSIVELNRTVGGVTVTVPNDDLAHIYPELTSGAVVRLNDNNVKDFLTWKDTGGQLCNNNRMERQKEFSVAFLNYIVESFAFDSERAWNLIEDNSALYLTSITKNQYLDLENRIRTESFDSTDYFFLNGEYVFDEKNNTEMFYVDEENLMEIVLSLFYLEEDN